MATFVIMPGHEDLAFGQFVHLTQGKSSTLELRLKELVEKANSSPKDKDAGRAGLAIYRSALS